MKSGHNMRNLALPIFVIWLFSFSFAAADFEAGNRAFLEGKYLEAYSLWLEDANEGNADAQVSIGSLYAYGRGVSQDDAEAVKWFNRAASQSAPPGMYALGMVLLSGKGVPQDATKGAELIERAAAAGFTPAKITLSMLYETGVGVKEDSMKAQKLQKDTEDDPFLKAVRRRISGEDQK